MEKKIQENPYATEEFIYREYDVVNREAIDYYMSFPPEELDRLIEMKEQEIAKRRQRRNSDEKQENA